MLSHEAALHYLLQHVRACQTHNGLNYRFTVYAEANWLHNSQQAGAVLDGTEVKLSESRNVGELKLGTEGQVNTNLNLWTNVAQ